MFPYAISCIKGGCAHGILQNRLFLAGFGHVAMTGKRRPHLTDAQMDCLRLVDAHLTSKEIARVLGISPFTVDQRLDAARKKLGAPNRVEAAKLFASIDNTNISQRLVYDPPVVAESVATAIQQKLPHQAGQNDEGIAASEYPDATAIRLDQKGLRKTLSLIFSVPPIGGERHNLSKLSVVLYSMNIAFYSTVIIAILIIVLTGVMRLLD